MNENMFTYLSVDYRKECYKLHLSPKLVNMPRKENVCVYVCVCIYIYIYKDLIKSYPLLSDCLTSKWLSEIILMFAIDINEKHSFNKTSLLPCTMFK